MWNIEGEGDDGLAYEVGFVFREDSSVILAICIGKHAKLLTYFLKVLAFPQIKMFTPLPCFNTITTFSE